MKSTNILSGIIAACLASSGAHGLATPDKVVKSPVPGYGVVELTWEVETTPGGAKAVLNGTIEQVHAQLLQINPKYEEDFAPIVPERLQAAAAAKEEVQDSSNLQKRDWTVCGSAGYGHTYADRGRIVEGIAYLNGLSGSALNGPGPRNCGRVSCSHNSAIWYCNNNSFSKSMPWFHVANAAQVLVNSCSDVNIIPGWGGVWQTRGERWHDDGWFAIVAGSTC